MPTATALLNSLTATHDPAANCLHACWPAAADSQHLRAHYADLLATASAHGNCRFWLLDLRARNWHEPDFAEWFGGTFAAAAHAALRQPVFLAYVLSPAHHVLASLPTAQATQRACATHDVYPFFFDSEAPAHAWLAHQQALDQG